MKRFKREMIPIAASTLDARASKSLIFWKYSTAGWFRTQPERDTANHDQGPGQQEKEADPSGLLLTVKLCSITSRAEEKPLRKRYWTYSVATCRPTVLRFKSSMAGRRMRPICAVGHMPDRNFSGQRSTIKTVPVWH
ncbi:MAG: hypothetical protein Q7J63_19130 [Rhodonellum sp.]|nr:hypothetical protein [Rhodonellum sp.]MDO9554617.1 hypothetical protein [Rhodonellum sp.]